MQNINKWRWSDNTLAINILQVLTLLQSFCRVVFVQTLCSIIILKGCLSRTLEISKWNRPTPEKKRGIETACQKQGVSSSEIALSIIKLWPCNKASSICGAVCQQEGLVVAPNATALTPNALAYIHCVLNYLVKCPRAQLECLLLTSFDIY